MLLQQNRVKQSNPEAEVLSLHSTRGTMTLFPFYISGCELHEIGQHWIEGSLCFSLICRQLSEYVDVICVHTVFSPSCVSVPEDLSLEERDELSNIRRRKRELLDDIEVCVLPNEHLICLF